MPGVATEVLTTNERLVWLRLAAARMRDTYVALAYGPVDGKGQQRQQCEHWWAELSEKQVGKYGRKGDVVVMGDLNACVVGDSKVNDNGRRLLELVEEHELVILNTEHARTKDVAGRGGQERLHHRLHPGAAAGSGSRGVDAGERRRRAGRRRSPSRASGVAYRTYKPARASATGGAAAAAQEAKKGMEGTEDSGSMDAVRAGGRRSGAGMDGPARGTSGGARRCTCGAHVGDTHVRHQRDGVWKRLLD